MKTQCRQKKKKNDDDTGHTTNAQFQDVLVQFLLIAPFLSL